MKLFKRFGFMALAAAFCFAAVSCGGSNSEGEAILKNVDVSFTITPTADFNDAFELRASVSGDTSKAQNVFADWSGDKFVIDLEYLTCPATISLNVERVPRDSFVADESKSYDLLYTVSAVVNKYYNDGSKRVVNLPASAQGGKVAGSKVAEYLERAKGNVATPLTLRLNANGDSL